MAGVLTLDADKIGDVLGVVTCAATARKLIKRDLEIAYLKNYGL